jgi:hypothetical protein
MKIKMVVSISGHAMPEYGLEDFAFNPEQVVDLADGLALKWLAGGHAVQYTDPEGAPKSETGTLGTEETAMLDNKPTPKKRG